MAFVDREFSSSVASSRLGQVGDSRAPHLSEVLASVQLQFAARRWTWNCPRAFSWKKQTNSLSSSSAPRTLVLVHGYMAGNAFWAAVSVCVCFSDCWFITLILSVAFGETGGRV